MIEQDVAVGAAFQGGGKKITAARLITFSGGPLTDAGWPRKNIHTDTDFAKSTGLPSRCASGTHFQGQMVEFMVDLFGERWFETGSMNVKFVDLVLEDQIVTAHAKVVDKKPDAKKGTRIELEVWSERNDGRKVMTGTAAGVVG
ncbi:MAG: MaoC family dehydratase [Xanthobacteraceae bacterium]|nr:MaoC family dehydratase [Xanthobacteraceae bacterium]MBX3522036.1 MaoC family dehydratase [Xanthobacteraceae bacterium]MBX3534612.1 MaoC family dehydratase [Xanthobacteraceae bacterium]MBX3549902.1 MaoC family dehydratase [Xanthobacteraceae bacterium]MCW5675633.1 MaoC family dehydratase [Xanthobacteraceae bacterium]